MESVEKQLADMLKELKSRSKTKVILETGFFAIIFFFVVFGNFLTLLVMVLNHRMRTIPHLFLASLAISDFCLGTFILWPLGLPVTVTSKWPFSDATCQYEGYIAVFLSFTSIHQLALMAMNRYFRIVRPIKYRRYFTKTKTTIMIFMSWLYSIGAPLPYILSGDKMVFHPFKFFCYLQIDSGLFTACMVTVYVGLPSAVIFYCYFKIFKAVRIHNSNFQNNEVATGTANVEEIKVTSTLFVIVVFFSLCWSPVLVIDIVDTIRERWTFPREVYLTYTFLVTISSALNPVIYGVLNKQFRKEYMKVLRCRYCRSRRRIVRPPRACGNAFVVYKTGKVGCDLTQ